MSNVNLLPITNSTSTIADVYLNNSRPINTSQQYFSPDYVGPILILVECIDSSKNLGSWHPLKAAKFFSNNFKGITKIKSASFKKIKISFDSIVNENNCLNSKSLSDHGFKASIPSSLIYSYGVIKLDVSISEEEFWEELQSTVPVEGFKGISIKKDGIIVQTRIVEIKFLSPKLPKTISLYNMLFEVNPSIRSPVQCNRCLRFGYTQKFCRSGPKCSHCSGDKDSIESYPVIQATDPVCLFCNLPHLATDRNCKEWTFQSEIKKIMATENISYHYVLDFKKK